MPCAGPEGMLHASKVKSAQKRELLCHAPYPQALHSTQLVVLPGEFLQGFSLTLVIVDNYLIFWKSQGLNTDHKEVIMNSLVFVMPTSHQALSITESVGLEIVPVELCK